MDFLLNIPKLEMILIFCLFLRLLRWPLAGTYGWSLIFFISNLFLIVFSGSIESINIISLLFFLSTLGLLFIFPHKTKGQLHLSAISFFSFLILLCWMTAKLAHSPIWFIETAFKPLNSGAEIYGGLTLFTGSSYLLLRVLQIWFDREKLSINNTNLLSLATWSFFFPIFIAGPIMRLEDWVQQEKSESPLMSDMAMGMGRIFVGLGKKVVLGEIFRAGSLSTLTAKQITYITPSEILIMTLFYGFYIYFEFSGYSDMAIGLGRILGITIPENFNWPYFSRNLQDFWTRWHISLSTWLKDFLYFPIGTWALRRKLFGINKKYNHLFMIFFPTCATFILCGLWHGISHSFFIWGAMHGIGVGTVIYFKRIIDSLSNKKRLFWEQSTVIRCLSTAITFFYVMLAWLPFASGDDKFEALLIKLLGY